MTTAHRPTWNPAHGGESQSGNRFLAPRVAFSSKDLPSHLTVKQRQPGQGTRDEVRRRDLRADLEAREAAAREDAKRPRRIAEGVTAEQLVDFSALEAEAKEREGGPVQFLLDPEDADDEPGPGGSPGISEPRAPAKSGGGGGGSGSASEDGDTDEDDDDDDDEDDTAELMRELERIKRERAAEEEARAAEAEEQEAASREEAVASANPLVRPGASGASFNVKRRWDDDFVFRNQAKRVAPEDKQPTFINDPLRTEFHKRFLRKYIK